MIANLIAEYRNNSLFDHTLLLWWNIRQVSTWITSVICITQATLLTAQQIAHTTEKMNRFVIEMHPCTLIRESVAKQCAHFHAVRHLSRPHLHGIEVHVRGSSRFRGPSCRQLDASALYLILVLLPPVQEDTKQRAGHSKSAVGKWRGSNPCHFYRAMLRRARLCYEKLSVFPAH